MATRSREEITTRSREETEIKVFGTIGGLKEYSTGEDWNVYMERLEQYFAANIIEGQRRVAVLLTAIGEETYKTLRDLCDPAKPASKTYEELKRLLDKQFAPRVSVFRERIKFYNLRQTPNESIRNWFVRCKNAAIFCKFSNQLNEILKDKFVSGMLSGRVLDRLCEEEDGKSLSDLVDLAMKKEASMKESGRLDSSVEINKIKEVEVKPKKAVMWKPSQKGTGDVGTNLTCYHCGKSNHNFAKCKYKNFKCKRCNLVGHLACVCKKKVRR